MDAGLFPMKNDLTKSITLKVIWQVNICINCYILIREMNPVNFYLESCKTNVCDKEILTSGA